MARHRTLGVGLVACPRRGHPTGYLFAFLRPIPEETANLSWLTPFGLSFANLFAFFGLTRRYFDEVIESFGPWLSFLAGLQTVTGFMLVFFHGLGLRNRFRLK